MQLALLKKLQIELKAAGLFNTVEMSAEQAARVRKRQYIAVSELANVTVLACLLNVAVLVLSFWESQVGRLVTIWGSIMLLVLSYVLFSIYRQRRTAHGEVQTDEQIQHNISAFVRGATTIGIMWGVIALVVVPFADPIGLTASGMLLVGTMFGGVLLIGRIPNAAMGLVIPVALGVLAGLQMQQDPRNTLLAIMTISYTSVLYFASRMAYQQFAQQQLSQLELEDRKELIGILLRDFEENTSDWLWQIDCEGILQARMDAENLVETKETSMRVGTPLIAMFENNEARTELQSAITEQRPFKDLLLKYQGTDGEEEWLRLSGKPVFTKGEFEGFRGIAADVTQLKRTEDQAAFMAQYDSLTGLPNRETLKTKLLSLSNDFLRAKKNIALVWLDLDNFKWINDTMGHMAGDELLCQLARRLTEELTPHEGVAARITGDEFVFFFEYFDEEDPFKIINDFETAFSQPYTLWGSKITCRATMGVNFIPFGVFDVEHSLKQADMALHNAKVQNKGSWVQFTQSLEDRAQSLRKLEADLDLAMERNELRLMFQPIVDAKTEKVVACETLLRWQHPTRGLLSPGAFISFAEDTGVIARLGDWVLREALVQAQRMPDDMRVAINLSPLQLHSQNLLPTIVNSIAQNGIKPNQVELEITESVMISDPEFTLTQLRKLKEIGVRIALDDFGTGFSSLSYLQKFQFDKLKIDRSFVEDIDINIDSQAITNATLQLAKALGMRTTGEGVETPRQAEYLRRNGCDELQGYMISRPLPLDQLGHLFDVKLKPMPEETGKKAIPLKTSTEYNLADHKVA